MGVNDKLSITFEKTNKYGHLIFKYNEQTKIGNLYISKYILIN